MADDDNLFEDGENLQAAIGKALQENKALLCFVSDDGDESTEWEVALLDEDIREKLQSTTVLLRLRAGSDQVGFLNSVCMIQSVPAIVIIHNAKVVANYQNGETTFDQLQKELSARYASSQDGKPAPVSSTTDETVYIDLPPSEGRMRLPNNAYDQFRKQTQEFVSAGLKGRNVLQLQLRLLESLKIDVITAAVKDIRQNLDSVTEPKIPDEVTDKLLNTPASKLRSTSASTNTQSADPRSASSASGTRSNVPASSSSSSTSTSQPPTSRRAPINRPESSPQTDPSSSSSPSTSHNTQRAQYIATQKDRESAQSTERARIKAQIAADKAARREAEAAAAAEQRRIDLQNLRKANSTTSDPKPSDVRIQVRLFDGATIRNSFPAEATVAKDVRNWIDGEVARKAVSGGSTAGQPYNLKLILTPLPNRSIEAGEEDGAISDLDGVRGSATMVMVPVRGYVESYSGSSGGVVGGVVGGATSMVGAGIGLVGSAAGLVVGGLGRLLGAGIGAGAGSGTGVGSSQSPQQQTPGRDIRESGETATTSGSRPNMRVRTLADQRMDEEDDRRKKGTQLYNGMGLNVQPRKDEDETK